MGLVGQLQSKTPKPYKFTLQCEFGEIVCKPEPLQWKEGITKLTRRMDSAGVFNSYSIDSLTFVGNGAATLKELFRLYQINAQCTLKVSKFDAQTFSYIDFPSSYALKFGTYKTVKVGKFAIGINISVTDTGTLSKFDERKKVSIDLTKLKSIGNLDIEDFEGFPLLSKLRVKALKFYFNANIVGGWLDVTEQNLANFGYSYYITKLEYALYAITPGYNSVEITTIVSDFPETQRVTYLFGSTQAAITPFFYNSTSARTLVIDFTVCVNVTNP